MLLLAVVFSVNVGFSSAWATTPPLNELVWGEVGTVVLPGWAEQLTVSSNTMYVANYDRGLKLFDIINPTAPIASGETATNPYLAEVIGVQGTLACVVQLPASLAILDVADPAAVITLGTIDLGVLSNPSDVKMVGTYAYVADNEGGLRIIDFSNPATPTLAASLALPYAINEARAIKLAQAGAYVYIAAGFSGLQIVDVSDPTQPVIVGSWQAQDRRFLDVAIAGNYAYLADWYGGMQVIDISNSTTPLPLGYFDTPPESHGIAVTNNVVFLANGQSGLFVIDVSNPVSPQGVAMLDTPGYALDVEIVGSTAYVADQTGGVRIVQGVVGTAPADNDGDLIPDISDPDDDNDGIPDLFEIAHGLNPYSAVDANTDADGDGFVNLREYQTGSLPEDAKSKPAFFEIASLSLPGFANPIAVEGNRAYVCSSRLNVVDISLPNNPKLLEASASLPSSCYDLAISGDFAYIANAISGGFRIYDLSNPVTPVQRGFVVTGKQSYGVAISGQYAYLADWDGGLRVIDVSNPDSPIIVNTVNFPSAVKKVTISGDYAYVAITYVSGGPQLRVLDITNPLNPLPVGQLLLPASTSVENMQIDGSFLYLADAATTGGLRVINISNPAAPILTAFLAAPNGGLDLAIINRSLLLAGRDSGLRVIDIANPSEPKNIGYWDTPGLAFGVAGAGNYAYVTDGNSGLRVFNFGDLDDDADSLANSHDNCPAVANADQSDFDGDRLGDACDPDDDNDGVLDINDPFPRIAFDSIDTDADGVGNNTDLDNDNDGLTDIDEVSLGLDPLNSADGSFDLDADGYTNLREYLSGSALNNSNHRLTWSGNGDESKLIPSGVLINDSFGSAVAGYGDVLAVADGYNSTETLYIFRNQSGSWARQQMLDASNGLAYDGISEGLAMEGSTIVGGARWNDEAGNNAGAVVVFNNNGSTWSEQAKITPADIAAEDRFGWSVAISGDRLVASSNYDDDKGENSGSAYVFQRSGASWVQEAKLTASDGAAYDYFGQAVAIEGNQIFVGASFDGDLGSASGSVYVFRNDGNGWQQVQKIHANDGAAFDLFGNSLSVSGNRLAVGAFADDDRGSASGAVYLFTYNGSSWEQSTKLTASDGVADDSFGNKLDLRNDALLVGVSSDDNEKGTNAGGAYLFNYADGSWVEHKLVASDGKAESNYGQYVALADGYAIIGAHNDDNKDINSGAVYVYPLNYALFVDTDADSLPDASDNCPAVANIDQANFDGDSLGDVCDPDDDNDGIIDTSDAFPRLASESVDTDSDGIGNSIDTDDDGDGIPDLTEIANGTEPLNPDTIVPALSLSMLADGARTNDDALNVSGTATDNTVLASLLINNKQVPVQLDGSFSTVLGLLAGNNIVTAIAIDAAGNRTISTRTIVLDQNVPQVTIATPADNSITSRSLTVVSGTVDEIANLQLVDQLGNFHDPSREGNSFSADIVLAEGLNTLTVNALDLAGNVGSDKRTIIYDPLTPSLSITTPAADTIDRDGMVTISGLVSDTLSDTTLSIMTGDTTYSPAADGTGFFSQEITLPEEGTYPIQVAAIDAAGNTTSINRNILYTRGLISINQGKEATSSLTVQLTLDYYPVAAKMRFCANNINWTAWEPYAPTKAVLLPGGDGIKTVYVQFLELEGKESQIYFDNIRLDTLPPSGSLSINNGATYTNSLDVLLTLSLAESAEGVQIQFSTNQTIWSSWEAFSTSKNWSFIGTEGTKTLYVRFKDSAGKISVIAADNIQYKINSPSAGVSGALVINSDALATKSLAVRLTMTKPEVAYTQMQFSTNNVTWSPWESFNTTRSFTLPSGDGLKTIYTRFRSPAGTSGLYSDSILLDTRVPVGTISLNNGAVVTASPILYLTLNASDLGGIAEMQFNENGTLWSSWEPYQSTRSYALSEDTLDGSKKLSARFKDRVGNLSTIVSDSIALDRVAPLGSVLINANSPFITSLTIPLTLKAPGAITMQLSLDNGSSWGNWEPYVTGKTVTLPIGDGVKTVLARFRDLAGNISTIASSSTSITTAPAPATLTVPSSDLDGNYPVAWGSAGTGYAYTLEEATAADFTSGRRTAYTGTASTVGITGRIPGKTYYYRIRAIKSGLAPSTWLAAETGCRIGP